MVDFLFWFQDGLNEVAKKDTPICWVVDQVTKLSLNFSSLLAFKLSLSRVGWRGLRQLFHFAQVACNEGEEAPAGKLP